MLVWNLRGVDVCAKARRLSATGSKTCFAPPPRRLTLQWTRHFPGPGWKVQQSVRTSLPCKGSAPYVFGGAGDCFWLFVEGTSPDQRQAPLAQPAAPLDVYRQASEATLHVDHDATPLPCTGANRSAGAGRVRRSVQADLACRHAAAWDRARVRHWPAVLGHGPGSSARYCI